MGLQVICLEGLPTIPCKYLFMIRGHLLEMANLIAKPSEAFLPIQEAINDLFLKENISLRAVSTENCGVITYEDKWKFPELDIKPDEVLALIKCTIEKDIEKERIASTRFLGRQ